MISTDLLEYENELTAYGHTLIAGIDEAGRGPLAGPVVACAVILPVGLIIDGVNDSKKVSEKKRTLLYEIIQDAAIAYAFGIVDEAMIDRMNILQATLLAMQLAVNQLSPAPAIALVDGTTKPILPCQAMCIAQGDSKSHTIAAASILAKVKRDSIMMALHEQLPQYDFAKHKGYGTKAHREAIAAHGLSPHHRRSFCRAFI